MKTVFNIILVTIILFLSSCFTYQKAGSFSTNACLSDNNFRIKKVISTTKKRSSIMGFGLNIHALVSEAKTQLYMENMLKDNQALANTSLDIVNSFFLIFQTTIVTISADIVEFGNFENENPKFICAMDFPINFEIGDSVSYKNPFGKLIKGKIVSANKDFAEIESTNIYKKVVTNKIKWQYIEANK